MSNGEKYYGKYRGTVLNNVDPLQIGRLMSSFEKVISGGEMPWLVACLTENAIRRGDPRGGQQNDHREGERPPAI